MLRCYRYFLQCMYSLCFPLLLLLFLNGCQDSKYSRLALPDPLLPLEEQYDADTDTVIENQSSTLPGSSKTFQVTRVFATPAPLEFENPELSSRQSFSFPYPDTEPADVNFHDMPLPAFINEVYGNVLGVSFEIAPELAKLRDLVTLRTGSMQTPAELDKLARQVLNNYGITVTRQGDLLRFVTSNKTTGETPLLVSGRALPEVPDSHRPVFQLVPLTVVRNTHVKGWLTQAFKGQGLEIFEDAERNAVLLKGSFSVVKEALAAVSFLDQPYMRGHHSLRIEPLFMGAEQLAALLVNVLQTEGYSASLKPPMGSIIILPVNNINAVLVFAATAKILDHVKEWALSLDKPGGQAGEKGIFFYDVQHTTAVDIGRVVNELLGAQFTSSRVGGTAASKTSKTVAVQSRQVPSGFTKRLVVDELSNSVIFQGEPGEWQEILGLIRHFDRPAKQVLIEVTIAEITLTEDKESGIEWIFDMNINKDRKSVV